MKMTELLDKDKEHLLTEIAASPSPDAAVRILEKETDKLLLKHNEQSASDSERDAAAYLMQAVRLSLPLIDSAGRTKVWEHETAKDEKPKAGIPAILLLLAGIAVFAYGTVPIAVSILAGADTQLRNDTLLRLACMAGGLIAIFVSGRIFRSPVSSHREHHVEIRVDSEKIYRAFRNVIISVDQSLAEVNSKEQWDKREQAGNIDGRPAMTSELDLFGDLLAASYSGDPEYALEKIDDIRYFLHKQQIEAVDYSEETGQFFDLMPGVQTGTIRPALVADGILLKKGLASTGK